MVVPKKELELCQCLELGVKILETEFANKSEKVLAPSPRPALLINFASFIFPASTGVRKLYSTVTWDVVLPPFAQLKQITHQIDCFLSLMINLITFKPLPKNWEDRSLARRVVSPRAENIIFGTQKSRKLTDQLTDINHCHFRLTASQLGWLFFAQRLFLRVHRDGWHIETSTACLCTLGRR